jgi:hypothetical protein
LHPLVCRKQLRKRHPFKPESEYKGIFMGRPKKLLDTPSDIKNLVTVAYAEDMELAEYYKRMLLDNSIPVAIQQIPQGEKTLFSDIAVMVPEEFLDAAYNFLARQAACDDFFDAVFGADTQADDGSDED